MAMEFFLLPFYVEGMDSSALREALSHGFLDGARPYLHGVAC
jgi:hypothetical protein